MSLKTNAGYRVADKLFVCVVTSTKHYDIIRSYIYRVHVVRKMQNSIKFFFFEDAGGTMIILCTKQTIILCSQTAK